jgi:dTDP-4-amino-4,6-dideoxygalactose transaminase
VIPAWTFIASAHAIVLAGLVPYFVDVDPKTWALDPRTIDDEIARAPAEVGAVMPVLPFGWPIDIAAWDSFQDRSRLPVVIDAAAGFDSLSPGATPAVVSLHATKVLGVGEGGFVMSMDTELVQAIRARTNFGFLGSRQAIVPAVNAKLSEYHAAVGHAGLDEWDDTRAEWMKAAQAYRGAMAESNRFRFQTGFGETWVASTCVVTVEDAGAACMANALAAAEIDSRRWWEDGAHAHPASKGFPVAALSATPTLSNSTLALPFYRDLRPIEIQRVVNCVMSAATSIQ